MNAAEKTLREELALNLPDEGCLNYSVKAGAGGGKTTLLSYRIGNQIAKGTPIEEFVIITYTNAAAAELREKITGHLSKLSQSKTLTKEEEANVTDALNTIELMQISTIHSFLFKILKEYAFEAGIVMDAEMFEDDKNDAKKQEFFDKWYRENFDEIQKYKVDCAYVTKTGKNAGKIVDHCREIFQNMFFDMADVREEVIFDTKDHTKDLEAQAVTYIDCWLPKLCILKEKIIENSRKPDGKERRINKEANLVITNTGSVDGAVTKGIKEAQTLSEALENVKIIKDNGRNIYNGLKDSIDDIDNAIMSIYTNMSVQEYEWNFSKYYEKVLETEKASRVAEYVCKMQKEYQKERDADTLKLSNDDILYRAEKLLTEHGDILDKLRMRYTKIYVDEFQDTTGQQTRIVEMLSEKVGTTLEEYDFEEDKLLVVGDAKQSIYRFTGAEKAVYDQVDKLMYRLDDSLAKSVSLDSNFRSNSDIVGWVNTSFGALIPGYKPMETDWDTTCPQALSGVYRYGNLNNSCSVEEDVQNVVELVKKLVNNPKIFLEKKQRDKDGKFKTPELTQIQYSDIMIIAKNATHISAYVEGFARCGIPVNVQGKFKIDSDEVLKNFVLLVDYFANYKNKKRRVTAVQILKGIDVARANQTEIKAVEDELRALRKEFREHEMNVAAIVQQLLSHEEYFIPKEKTLEVERVRTYRIRLHQMVETCLNKNTGDLSEFERLLEDYMKAEVKREIPLESNENAIRLMNAHQSKGLTGQIVIIADRSANEGCRYSAFKKEGKYYPTATFMHSGFRTTKTVIRPSYAFDKNMLRQAYKDENEEAIRLQYVAATRAAHALIIMPVATKNNVPWFTNSEYNLDSKTDIIDWMKEREADEADYKVVDKSDTSRHATVNLEELSANCKAMDETKLTENQLIGITPSGLEILGVTGFNPADEGYKKENRPSGSVFGTVMHRVYELIFSRYAFIDGLALTDREKAVERIINQAILEQAENMEKTDKGEDYMNFLKPIIMDYMTKVIAPIIAEAAEIYPEYTFSFYVEDAQREDFLKNFDPYLKAIKNKINIGSGKIWVNGQADLVVKKKDGSIKVYDYKSDAMNGKEMAAFEESQAKKYAGQLALYRYAIGKAFGVSEVETELIHLYR